MIDSIRDKLDRQKVTAIVIVLLCVVVGYMFFLKGPLGEKKQLSEKINSNDGSGNSALVQASPETKRAAAIAAPGNLTARDIKKQISKVLSGNTGSGKKIDPPKVRVTYKKVAKPSVPAVRVSISGDPTAIAQFVSAMTSGAHFDTGRQLAATGPLFMVKNIRIKNNKAANVKISAVPVPK